MKLGRKLRIYNLAIPKLPHSVAPNLPQKNLTKKSNLAYNG